MGDLSPQTALPGRQQWALASKGGIGCRQAVGSTGTSTSAAPDMVGAQRPTLAGLLATLLAGWCLLLLPRVPYNDANR